MNPRKILPFCTINISLLYENYVCRDDELEYKHENRASKVQGGWLATLSTPPDQPLAIAVYVHVYFYTCMLHIASVQHYLKSLSKDTYVCIVLTTRMIDCTELRE